MPFPCLHDDPLAVGCPGRARGERPSTGELVEAASIGPDREHLRAGVARLGRRADEALEDDQAVLAGNIRLRRCHRDRENEDGATQHRKSQDADKSPHRAPPLLVVKEKNYLPPAFACSAGATSDSGRN